MECSLLESTGTRPIAVCFTAREQELGLLRESSNVAFERGFEQRIQEATIVDSEPGLYWLMLLRPSSVFASGVKFCDLFIPNI